MIYLSREAILNAQDMKFEEVDVPEWGGKVRVKTMSGSQRDAFEASLMGDNSKMKLDNIRAKLIALTVVDDDGKAIFTSGDIDALGKKSAAPIDRIFTVSQRLNGITQADVDGMVKNSETVPNDTSIIN